jgi:hypothetical protein
MEIPDGQYIPMCIYVRLDRIKFEVRSMKFEVSECPRDRLNFALQTSNFELDLALASPAPVAAPWLDTAAG